MSTNERDNPKIMEAWNSYEIVKKQLDDFHAEWEKKFSGPFGWYYKHSPGQRYKYNEYLLHHEDRLDGAKMGLDSERYDARQGFEHRERKIQARTRRQFTAIRERWGLAEDFTIDQVEEIWSATHEDLTKKGRKQHDAMYGVTFTPEQWENFQKIEAAISQNNLEHSALYQQALRREWGLPEDFSAEDVKKRAYDIPGDFSEKGRKEDMLIEAAGLFAEARKIDAQEDEKDPEILKAKAEAEKAIDWENVTTLGADSEPENEPIIETDTVSEIDPETVAEDTVDFDNHQEEKDAPNYSQQVEDARERWGLPHVFTEPNVKERYPVMVENAEADELDRVHEEYEILLKEAA